MPLHAKAAKPPGNPGDASVDAALAKTAPTEPTASTEDAVTAVSRESADASASAEPATAALTQPTGDAAAAARASASALAAKVGAAALDRHRRGVAAGAAGRPAAAAGHFRAGLRLLEPSPPPGTEPVTARLLTSLAHAEAELGRVERGLELLERAEPLAEPGYRAVVVSQRALLLWRVGRYQAALPAFDEAVPLLADHPDRMVLARVLLNRGGLRMAAGQIAAARADSRRCEQIARECGEPALAAKAVHNRGYCDLLLGNIPAALEAFERAEATYRVHTPGIVPIAEVDRARALLAAGLADEAAAGLESAIKAFRVQRLSQDRAEAELALAQALAAAGKPTEAAARARQAEQHFRARGNETWAALAELTRARADFAALTATITTATTMIVSSTNAPTATMTTAAMTITSPTTTSPTTALPTTTSRTTVSATMVSLSPTSPSTALATAPLLRFASRAARLADRLDHVGLPHDAAFARVLSARALIRAGKTADRITPLLERARPRGVAVPLELRLAAHLARAELAAAHGDRAVAFAELRSGLTRLHEQRRTLGSLDLQTGTATLGGELTSTGLRLALDSGSARAIFAWSERSRAQAFRVRPVRPPDDPQTAADLAEFRKLDENLRNAELGGRTDPAARHRHAVLRRQLREQSWKTSGSRPGSGAGSRSISDAGPGSNASSVAGAGAGSGSGASAEAAAPATLAEIAAELADCGHAMISLLRQEDQLLALAIADGKATLVSLGGYAHSLEAAYRLLSDLDARGGRRLPERLQVVIDQSIRRQLDVLTAEVTAPLRPYVRDLPVIVVPTGPLATVPWSLLPDLRGRPVTVCPSAQLWLAAHRSERSGVSDGPPDSRPVLAAGPRLAHADAEVAAIADFYSNPVVLTGRAATVEATLRAMDGARTVHLAAHGHHERGNVMFARIDLADGPLMAYDLQRLSKPPQRVILSACEVGRSEIRGGDEHLGFTAALLYAGTSTVIASGALVPDTAAAPLMAALHRALAVGAAPAAALAGAMAVNQADPFVCFGAG